MATVLALGCSGAGKKKLSTDAGTGDPAAGADGVFIDSTAGDATIEQEVTADLGGPGDLAENQGDTGLLPDGCCLTDDDCDDGHVCVGYEGGPWPEAGSCQPAADAGQCWSDADCTAVEDWCQNPVVCGCGEKCALQPGWCVHTDPPFCCHVDADCGQGQRCVGGDLGAGGVCFPPPEAGECFEATDCGQNEYCVNEFICSCDMNCISEPGACIPYGVACCFAHSDCEAGEFCAPASGLDDPGVCKAQPPAGMCWGALQCKADEVCYGVSICPCDADCDGLDMPGKCIPACTDDDCCCGDDDCGQGLTCALVAAGNACLPEQTQGMCWDDSDCGDMEYCHGAVACPCNWDCDGDGWDIPGQCKPTGGDLCCMNDSDCPQFFMGKPMVCLIHEGNPDVVGTCQSAAPLGKCWREDDCYMEQVCQGVIFCPCGMDCDYPGTTMGECSPLPGGCCYSDGDCDEEDVCKGVVVEANQPGHCVPHPDGPACPFDAACCWDDADCTGGTTCKNSQVCGCIELCPVCGDCAPDQMGYCS